MDQKRKEVIEKASQTTIQKFPYIPGFLGFREAPVLFEAYHLLKIQPDILFIDGHGIAHPRGLGIASHIGILLDVPTIGVAKTLLVGKPKKEVGEKVGSYELLYYKEKIVGCLLRTKARTHPLVLSPGHRVSLETTLKLVLSMINKYKLPEPTRQAHLYANTVRKAFYSEALR